MSMFFQKVALFKRCITGNEMPTRPTNLLRKSKKRVMEKHPCFSVMAMKNMLQPFIKFTPNGTQQRRKKNFQEDFNMRKCSNTRKMEDLQE